jgi:hypothetical protein
MNAIAVNVGSGVMNALDPTSALVRSPSTLDIGRRGGAAALCQPWKSLVVASLTQ